MTKTRDGGTSARPPLQWVRNLRWPEIVAGTIATAGSVVSPIGYDEAYWLAIAKMVLGGRNLYVDALDNKTPLIHLITLGIDALPGPFGIARGIILGLVVAFTTRQLHKIATSAGNWTGLAAGIAGTTIAALSQFHLTTELLALACLVGALNRIRTLPAGVLTLMAAGFDPRALLLLPAVALFRASADQADLRRYLATVGAGVAVALAVIVALPNLRFGLLELSLSIRGADLSGFWPVALAVLAPLASLLLAGFRLRVSVSSLAWGLGSLAIPVLSLIPFDHYWVYVPAMATFGFNPPVRPFLRVWTLTFIVALLPFVAIGHGEYRDNKLVLEDQLQAAALVESRISGGSLIYAGASPFLVMELASQSLLRSPTAYYLVYPSRRSPTYDEELPALLQRAAAFAYDDRNGVIAFDERAVLAAFPCAVHLKYTTVRFRPEFCPETRRALDGAAVLGTPSGFSWTTELRETEMSRA